MPSHRSGVASALLNSSREVAGLLGITVIGGVLRSRQGAALRDGLAPGRAFLDGYHAGLAVTIALTAAGIVIAMIALRRADTAPLPAPEPTPSPELVPAPERAAAPVPIELAPGQAARLPELHAPDSPLSGKSQARLEADRSVRPGRWLPRQETTPKWPASGPAARGGRRRCAMVQTGHPGS
jgi:hypothetical protein